MSSSAHALPRVGATLSSHAAFNGRIARRTGYRNPRHSRAVVSQRLRVHTKATTGPVHTSTAPRAVSPAELNEVGVSFWTLAYARTSAWYRNSLNAAAQQPSLGSNAFSQQARSPSDQCKAVSNNGRLGCRRGARCGALCVSFAGKTCASCLLFKHACHISSSIGVQQIT